MLTELGVLTVDTVNHNFTATAKGAVTTGDSPTDFLIRVSVNGRVLTTDNDIPVHVPAHQIAPWTFRLEIYSDYLNKLFARLGAEVLMSTAAGVFGGTATDSIGTLGDTLVLGLTAETSSDGAAVSCDKFAVEP